MKKQLKTETNSKINNSKFNESNAMFWELR